MFWWFSGMWIWTLIKWNFNMFIPKSDSLFQFDIKTDSIVVFLRTHSTSSFSLASLRQRTPPQLFTSDNITSCLSVIPVSLRFSSCIETSFAVHSYPWSTYLFGNHDSVSSLSAFNTAEHPYHSLDKNCKPPTPDPYQYPLRLDIQLIIIPDKIWAIAVLL